MGSMTLTYGAASMTAVLCTALMALMERFGASPIPSVQGSSVTFAGQYAVNPTAAAKHAAHAKTVDRTDDVWVLPRGQRL